MNREYKEKLSRKIEKNYLDLEMRIMQDIVRRIRKTGEITSTADWQINRLIILGNSTEDIEKMLKETLDASYPKMFELYDKVVDWEYVRSKDIYEQIKTTLPKAKELRPYVEKLISLGKDSSVANRRRLFAKCRDNSLVAKVFGTLAQRYNSRNGGYTRIVKAGFREGDCAPMAVIELLDRDPSAKQQDVVVADAQNSADAAISS